MRIIFVDSTTYAIIQVAKAMWYLSLLLLAGLAFLFWGIYAVGAKLAGPAGGIGAVLTVILACVGIAIAAVPLSATNAPVTESAVSSSSGEAQPEQSPSSSGPDTMVMESGSPSEEAQPEQSPSNYSENVYMEGEGDAAEEAPSEQSTSPGPPFSSSEEELGAFAEDYYEAVALEDWEYLYGLQDSQTQQEYTEDEYIQKNQYFAELDSLAETSTSISSEVSISSPVEVTLTQTFDSGATTSRVTYFVWEAPGSTGPCRVPPLRSSSRQADEVRLKSPSKNKRRKGAGERSGNKRARAASGVDRVEGGSTEETVSTIGRGKERISEAGT